jgi:hypothetical protein
MTWQRRQPSDLDQLLRWRRNIFVQAPGGGYAIVSKTGLIVGVSYFQRTVTADADCNTILLVSEHPHLTTLHDGQGWDLAALQVFLCSEEMRVFTDEYGYRITK